MLKGLIRYQQCDCFHFITFCCYHRYRHLDTAPARELFEHSLEAMRRRYDFVVWRVASVSVMFPNQNEGAPGPLQLGTGD
jgi:REP element-mobilizing transposase RayT